MQNILVVVMAFLFALQCSKSESSMLRENTETKWVLENLSDYESNIVDIPNAPVLNINLNDSSYFGYSGCNNYRGKFTINQQSIQFLPGLMTRKACIDGNLENQYIKMLHKVDSYQMQKGKLLLLYKGEVQASFKSSHL